MFSQTVIYTANMNESSRGWGVIYINVKAIHHEANVSIKSLVELTWMKVQGVDG